MPKRHRQPEPLEGFGVRDQLPPRAPRVDAPSPSSPSGGDRPAVPAQGSDKAKASAASQQPAHPRPTVPSDSSPKSRLKKVVDGAPRLKHRKGVEDSFSLSSPDGSSEDGIDPGALYSGKLSSQSGTSDSCVDYDSDDVGDDGNQHDDDAGDLVEEEEENGLFDGDGSSTDENDNDDGDEGEDTSSEGSERRDHVNVDFGVYDMESRHVDAVMHLIDQFCPDKMNEIDRDDFGAALVANPLTCIVKLSDSDGDAIEEEEEVYGLVSGLDVVQALRSHPAAFKPLCEILKASVWRTVSPGIPPTDILLSTAEATAESKSTTRCLLLVMEYVRNVPLELTVEIFEDLIRRVEQINSYEETTEKNSPHVSSVSPNITSPAGSKKAQNASEVTASCRFAVLAKIQRAKDAVPVKKVKASNMDKPPKGKRRDARETSAADNELDLSQFIFWREEDSILFEHRDQRVATWAYRCRSQYVDQPVQEIPLSLLFVMQPDAMHKAIEDIKKRVTTHADVVHF